MLSDLNLEQQENVNMQKHLLQIKHEYDEVRVILYKEMNSYLSCLEIT
jgi:hypothetical protein